MKEILNNYPLLKSAFNSFIKSEFKVDINNKPKNEFSFVIFLFFIKNKLLCSTINYLDNENQKWKNKLVCTKTGKTLYEKDSFNDYFFARREIYQMACRILETRLFENKVESKIKDN